MPFTSLVGHPYLEQVAVLAVYNDIGSQVKINVKRILARPLTAREDTIPQKANFQRITGLSGGTDLTAIKIDSNTANLPPQIQIKEDLLSVSTSGSVIRSIMDLPMTNFSRVLAGLADRSVGAYAEYCDSAQALDAGYVSVGTQGWILREGEGLALVFPIIFTATTYRLNVVFTTEDGTYIVTDAITPDPGRPTFALFNGSGSGKIVTVRLIELVEVGDDSLPYFSVEAIDGLIPDSGQAVTSIPMDTLNSLPSAVLIRKDCTVYLSGHKHGTIMANPRLRQTITPIFGKGSTDGINWAEGAFTFTAIEQSPESLIKLREGEGIAIIKRNASALARIEIAIEFTTTSVAAGGLTEKIITKDYPMVYVKSEKAQELRSKISG
jgi:hypothetical protein